MEFFRFLSKLISLIIFLFKEFFPVFFSFVFQFSILSVGGILFYGGFYAARYKQSIFEDPSHWLIIDAFALLLWIVMLMFPIKTIDSILDTDKPSESILIMSFIFGIPILIGALLLSKLGLGVYMYEVNTMVGMCICIEYFIILFIKPST